MIVSIVTFFKEIRTLTLSTTYFRKFFNRWTSEFASIRWWLERVETFGERVRNFKSLAQQRYFPRTKLYDMPWVLTQLVLVRAKKNVLTVTSPKLSDLWGDRVALLMAQPKDRSQKTSSLSTQQSLSFLTSLAENFLQRSLAILAILPTPFGRAKVRVLID